MGGQLAELALDLAVARHGVMGQRKRWVRTLSWRCISGTLDSVADTGI